MTRARGLGWLVAILGLAGALGCAQRLDPEAVLAGASCVECAHPACADPLDVHYLGSGGFWLKRGDDEVLTAPFYSNPGLFRVGVLPIEPNRAVIEENVPREARPDVILVGHGHYDHLMDLPVVMEALSSNFAPGEAPPRLLASRSAIHTVAPAEMPVTPVNLMPFGWRGEGDWQPVEPVEGSIRIIAIESEHAPHLGQITLLRGRQHEPRERLPRWSWGWVEGQTYAFVIEFLGEDGRPGFRIHYQDSASDGARGEGLPPTDLDAPGAPTPYKILLPTVASWENVEDYPDELIDRFRPDFAVLAHWEDFFDDFTTSAADVRPVVATDVAKFVGHLEGLEIPSGFVLPAPATRVRFARTCPEGERSKGVHR